MGRIEAGMKQMEESMQALADRFAESMQGLREEVGQDFRQQAQCVEELRRSVTATQLAQATTKKDVEAALGELGELRAGVQGCMRQHGDSIAAVDAKTSHAVEQVAASREQAEGMSARVDSVQSEIALVRGHLRELSASMEVVEGHANNVAGAQWIAKCVTRIDTALVSENQSLAQQIEHLDQALRDAKELCGSNIQEELQRLFDELQEAQAETARAKEHAQQAKAQHDRDTVHHHEEVGRIQEVVAELRKQCERKDVDYEQLREEVAVRDMNIEWQREQANLANLWLKQQPSCFDPTDSSSRKLSPMELLQRGADSGGTGDPEDPHLVDVL